MKKIKSVVSKLLVTALAASFALMLPGCADAESVLPEYTDDKTITLGAWGAPPPTKEGYETFAAAGFNFAFQDFRQLTSSALHDVMVYAEETGVKMWIQTGSENYDKPEVIQKIYDEDLDQYDSFDGINFYDEPGAVRFDGIADLIPQFEQNYPDAMFVVNLFPSYADGSQLGAGGFEGYVTNYVDKVLSRVNGRKFLSFDYYPLMTDFNTSENYLADTWLSDLDIVSNAAKFTDIETHCFSQTRKFGNNRAITSAADVRFQYAVSMAYGFKGISAFMYNAASSADGSWGEGLVNGSKINPEYYYAKEANEEVLKFDHVYLSFDYLGTMPVQPASGTNCQAFMLLRHKLDEVDGIETVVAEQPALVGSFRDKEDNNGYMIVNYTEPSGKLSNTVTVNFEKGISKARVYRKGVPEDVEIKDGTLTLDLESGEGAFVIAV